jgi:LysR family glycine cleavage system transcriptional activator
LSALPFFANTVLIPRLASFTHRCPGVTLHIDTSHQYADFEHSTVDAAIRFGRERAGGLRVEPLLAVRGLPVCAPGLANARLRQPRDLAGQTLIHCSQRPLAWRIWLTDVGAADIAPRGELWLDSVPAALAAAAHGLGVALAMDPLIHVHPGFGTTLVAPMPCCSERTETLYFVTRPERAHERNIECLRCWLQAAVTEITSKVRADGANGGRSGKRQREKQGST